MTGESWLPVIGYEGLYEVSDIGRVRTVTRIATYLVRGRVAQRRWPSVVLSTPLTVQGGYPHVNLRKNGASKTRVVHQLVLTAFVGPRPDRADACHWDGDPTNNRLDNLRWDSRSANARDMKRVGRHNNQTKVQCPRKHALRPPNLCKWTARKGRRECLACSRGRDRVRANPNLDLRTEADRIYAELMSYDSYDKDW